MSFGQLCKAFVVGTFIQIIIALVASTLFESDIGAAFLAFNIATIVFVAGNRAKNTVVTATVLSPALFIGGWAGIVIAVAVQVLVAIFSLKIKQP